MSLSVHTAIYTTNLGTVLANRPVTVRKIHDAMAVVTVYSDLYGTTPATTTDGIGAFKFYATPGLYSLAIGPYRYNAEVGDTFVGFGESDAMRAHKTVTQTISNTVLADDPDLQLAVVANATYEMKLFYKGAAEPGIDFRLGFTGPAGSSVDWVSPSGPEPLPVFQSGEEVKVDGSSDSTVAITARGFVYTGATAGTVHFRRGLWSAGTGEVQAGSWLQLTRVA